MTASKNHPLLFHAVCAAGILVLGAVARAQTGEEPARDGRSSWALDVEPMFMGSTAKIAPAGARETAFVPAIYEAGTLRAVHGLRFILLDPLDAFVKVATRNAEQVLERADAIALRRADDSLAGYRLESGDPRLAGGVLGPKFYQRFAAKLGETFLVIIPARDTVFVLRREKEVLEEFKQPVTEAYKAAAWPASLELFEFSKSGIQAIGTISKEER